jgi:hypothetical protein
MYDEVFGKHAILSDNPTIEEIATHTAGFFEADWKTSKKYIVDDLQTYQSKAIKQSRFNSQFATTFIYVSEITSNFGDNKFDGIPKLALNELLRWDGKGGFCIYSAVLSYCLLYENGAFNKDELKLVQGFYKHPTEGILQLFNFNNQQVGLHAFITADGSVVDFAICQERCVFNFDGSILGELPDGMELYGWEEDFSIVKEYAREIARESGLTYRQWINGHSWDSLIVAKDEIKKISCKRQQKTT